MKTNNYLLSASNIFLSIYNSDEIGDELKFDIANAIQFMALQCQNAVVDGIDQKDFKDQIISIVQNHNENQEKFLNMESNDKANING